MDLMFDGWTVDTVAFDFSLRLAASGGGGISIEVPVMFEHDGAAEIVQIGTSDRSGDGTFDALAGLTVDKVIADAGCKLTVTFTDGTRLIARPVPLYESWEALAPNRVQYLCAPGPELVTYGLNPET
jgi:hypothetical protein